MAEELPLAGRVAIVTGGGRGLGRAMALGLARAGARVLITAAHSKGEIQAVAEEGGDAILPLVADVTDPADCKRAVQTARSDLDGLDVVVNNAGRGMKYVSEDFLTEPTRFWETDPEIWRMVIETNVNGPFLMARAAVPAMLEAGRGRIINISMNHSTMRRRGFSPYGPSKAALESETIIWAQELAGTGVTVNALLPGGATATGMIPEGVSAETRARLLDPEIIVPPLLWLASDAAGGVTGRRIDASKWDTSRPAPEAAKGAMEMAGWMPSA